MINKIRNSCIIKLNSIATNLLMYLPVAVFGILMCFAVNAVFGAELIVVALVSLFSVKALYNTSFNTANYLRNAGYLFFIV